MAKDVIITPVDGDVQFKNASSVEAGRIEQTGDDLAITNAVGDVLIGDGASDLYIGDGVNSVDIVFDVNGSVRGEAGVTLTLGASGSTTAIAGLSSSTETSAVMRNTTTGALTYRTLGSNAFNSTAYLTSFTETDPTVPSHVKNITTGDISNWDTAYNNGLAGVSFDTSTGILSVSGQTGAYTADLDGRYLESHPDTSTLSGTYGSTADGTKIDQITVDSNGHITAITTGNTGDILGVTAGSGLSGGGTSGTVTLSHSDTSSQASVNNSNGTVIQDVTLDTYGHVTGLVSYNLDGRYYTETEIGNFFGGTTAITGYNKANWDSSYNNSLSGVSFDTGTGILSVSAIGGAYTVDLDGRYLEAHPDTSTLSGTYGSTADGTKIDQITVDANGHITAITTGNTGDITQVNAGSGLTGGGSSGTITLSHADTSSQASVDNSGGTVIQDITLDTYGHITALTSYNLDGRYYTETESDGRYLRSNADDTGTGQITLQRADDTPLVLNNTTNGGYVGIEFSDNAGGSYAQKAYLRYTHLDSQSQGGGASFHFTGTENGLRLVMPSDGVIKVGTNTVFHDGYHPNADELTTAREINLSGDATGSVFFDGSADVTLNVAVTNDSHTHDTRYLRLTGGTLTGTLTSTATEGLFVDSASYARINLDSNNNWSYVRLSDNGSVSWDMASFNGGNLEWRPSGSSTNRMTYDSSGNLTLGSSLRIVDSNTALTEGSGNAIRHQTNSGYIDVGPQNTTWAHIYTDRNNFYFNKNLYVLGDRVVKTSDNIDALNDYEEGTFTPAYGHTSGNPSTVTYDTGNTYGKYTKIGNVVHCSGRIRTDAITWASTTYNTVLKGFPFTCSSPLSTGTGCVAGVIGFAGGFASTKPVTFQMRDGQTEALLYGESIISSEVRGQPNIKSGDFTTGTNADKNFITFQITYHTS